MYCVQRSRHTRLRRQSDRHGSELSCDRCPASYYGGARIRLPFSWPYLAYVRRFEADEHAVASYLRAALAFAGWGNAFPGYFAWRDRFRPALDLMTPAVEDLEDALRRLRELEARLVGYRRRLRRTEPEQEDAVARAFRAQLPADVYEYWRLLRISQMGLSTLLKVAAKGFDPSAAPGLAWREEVGSS